MASKADLLQSIKNRRDLEAKYPSLAEKERIRIEIEKATQEYLKNGGIIKEIDHRSNRAAQDKTTLNRYQNQKAKNQAEWALAREAEINKVGRKL